MKLVKAHVTNYRSVDDSTEFSLDQVTCLVGKNEAGKSAILTALAALNPHPLTPQKLDRERDYPRRYLPEYTTRHPVRSAIAVSTTWEISPETIATFEREFGAGVLKSSTIGIVRRYGADRPESNFEIDQPRAIANALTPVEVDEAVKPSLLAARTAAELIDKIGKVQNPSESLKTLLAKLNEHKDFVAKANTILTTGLPQFMYFSSYDRMAGAVQLEELNAMKADGTINNDKHSDKRLFLEFLEYSGATLEEILKATRYETFNAMLQGASNGITGQILDYWTQNPDLRVEIKVDAGLPGDEAPFNAGRVARARIFNDLHRADTPFSERSAGFVWFFSFLVKFAQVKKSKTPIVLLLDEPGLTLHGKAQADLLRYFDDKLAPHHQIIYSTHSPFMVHPERLTSTRTVEDVVEQKGARRIPHGTKVRDDVLANDPDAVFPLQGALGYEITQSLFVGKHTLLVEGASDILYLKALSHELKKRGRTNLDVRWTLCPTGGIGKVQAFVSLFGGKGLDVAVLADATKADTKKIEDLKRRDVLKAGRVLTIADFTAKDESDIEDLFEPNIFVEIVNKGFALQGKDLLTPTRLEDADKTTVRLVKKVEVAFKLLTPGLPDYDHFTPSSWLIAHPELLAAQDADTTKTLDRAEALFKALNALL